MARALLITVADAAVTSTCTNIMVIYNYNPITLFINPSLSLHIVGIESTHPAQHHIFITLVTGYAAAHYFAITSFWWKLSPPRRWPETCQTAQSVTPNLTHNARSLLIKCLPIFKWRTLCGADFRVNPASARWVQLIVGRHKAKRMVRKL